jgi:hypothetical protein
MRLTDEMIQEDDKRFKRQDLLAEFNYCGKEVPKRKSITNDDIRFYAWLCRSAYTLLKEQEPKYAQNIGQQISCLSGLCPSCGKMLNSTCNENFCGRCGQEVKWCG